jgi:hypothetical protein
MTTDITTSNSLADLAARINAEHKAVATTLRDSVAHAITAGELLIEAKDRLAHGEWLPWLREHCNISERTAQLYMRTAKNRAAIEARAKSATVADLTLNETAALLMMSTDVRKLLAFAEEIESLSGEALIEKCIANDVAMIRDESYNPFAGRSEAEKLEWLLFTIFLSIDTEAGRPGKKPEHACYHVEYVLQRPFQNVDEWLGPEGDRYRRVNGYSHGGAMPERFKAEWAAFRDAHRHYTLADAEAKLGVLHAQFERDVAAGRISAPSMRRAKRRRSNGGPRPPPAPPQGDCGIGVS